MRGVLVTVGEGDLVPRGFKVLHSFGRRPVETEASLGDR